MKDRTVIAIMVAFCLVAAGTIVVLEDQNKDLTKQDISVLSRVNTEGSGIYIMEKYDNEDFFEYGDDGEIKKDEHGNPIYKIDGWRSLVFGTPGASSIQHLQLQDIVENKLELKFEKYYGGDRNQNSVYYDDSITNATLALSAGAIDKIDAGIIWEPQYHAVIENPGWKSLSVTNILFPDHTCCVIAGYVPSINEKKNSTIRFLAGFVETTHWINDALTEGPSGENYQWLVNFTMKLTGGNFDVITIEESLKLVTYTYGDKDEENPLGTLKTDITELIDTFYDSNIPKIQLSDLGFDSSKEFTNYLVDDSYLKFALKYEGDYSGNKDKLSIAAIGGDIHQLALQLGVERGIYEKMGLELEIIVGNNGAAVAAELLAGNCDLGFLGAPPLLLNTINSEALKK